jgi:hypothetical protein
MYPSPPPESKDPVLDCAKACELILDLAPSWRWADVFVDLKMWFHGRHGRGLISSTSHGIDFFRNIIDVAEGRMKWEEEGQYGDNFRKLVLQRPRLK